MKVIVVFPVYNHPTTIAEMVRGVLRHGVDCLLVDDGSDQPCAQVLDEIELAHPDRVRVLHLSRNQGKGAAVLAGAHWAHERGYSHMVQIDADGQHDPAQLPRFLELARKHMDAVICGVPAYDASVPRLRYYGRYLTHVWVWINTLSFDIRDAMCGYRVYPLVPLCQLSKQVRLGQRMDFDTDVLVRMHWQGIRIHNLDTPVTYPRDGISHFDLVRDNARISLMHARLFFGMLRRLPSLLRDRLS
ncbi:MAG: glycosyl transferase [Lysobacteraceae bacterium]|nr:MAG: glycosyl transferase [Xanthomonadaceae bacterium]